MLPVMESMFASTDPALKTVRHSLINSTTNSNFNLFEMIAAYHGEDSPVCQC